MYLSKVPVLYDFWPEAAMLPWRTEPGPVAVELVRQYARVRLFTVPMEAGVGNGTCA